VEVSPSIRDRVSKSAYDAVIVGAGPNGLSAAAMLAGRGASVLVLEAGSTAGGGCRTAELTVPGLKHDICSAIHPLGLGSPFLRTLPLEKHGLEWVQPDIPLAHPFDDAPPALLHRSIEETAETLGSDSRRYKKLIAPLTPDWDELCAALLNPLKMARYPFGLARFGLPALLSSRSLTDFAFEGGRAKAFISGLAAHSFLPLDKPITAAYGLVLAITGHAVGWPVARGGSQSIADALVSYIRSAGGEVVVDALVRDVDELPEAKVVLCDVAPLRFAEIAKRTLPEAYRRKLLAYRYGPATFKIDWAIDGPVPWKDAECARAGTVHLGPTRADIVNSERSIWQGAVSQAPFVLVAQQSLFDRTRIPEDRPNVQALWAYCHVPSGYTVDCTEIIEAQIERFAPGFRDRILARHTYSPAEFERYNANYVGGDINGGVLDFAQLIARPVLRTIPYATPVPGLYLCSASTPPGGGVHGMCGYYAALAALRDL
jgi:phytoene dehydrogenase-like protein